MPPAQIQEIAWHQRAGLKAAGVVLAGAAALAGCGSADRAPLSGADQTAYASCGTVDFQPKSDAEGNFGYKVTPHSITTNTELMSYVIQWDKDQEPTDTLQAAEQKLDDDPFFHAYKKPGTYTIRVDAEFKNLAKKENSHETDPAKPIEVSCGAKEVKVTQAQINKAREVKDSPYQWSNVDPDFKS